MEPLGIDTIAALLVGIGTAIGVIITLYKVWEQRKQEFNRRFSELIINSARAMNKTLSELIVEKDRDLLLHKAIAYLDELDTLVVLVGRGKINADIAVYFSYDIAVANKIIEWLDSYSKKNNLEPEIPEGFYSKRWEDIVDWVKNYERKQSEELKKEYAIPINPYDLPEIMRD